MWGNNSYGQLGDGTTTGKSSPVQVSGLTGITAIAAGWGHTVALKNDGTVWAWGDNHFGQLGDNTTTRRLTPVQISGLTDFPVQKNGVTGVQISGLTSITAIAAGAFHTFALSNDGTVWAWGRNDYGQLGFGIYSLSLEWGNPNTPEKSPVKSIQLTDVKAIAAGRLHTVVLKNDGTVWAFGLNDYGQLGLELSYQSLHPEEVSGLTDVKAIAAGDYHTFALKNDGTVWAWGRNDYGQLGDGTTTKRKTPVHLSNLTDVKAIAAGSIDTFALKNDGTVWAWGNNSNGRLGDGTTTQRLSSVQVSGLTDITAIASGYYHAFALKSFPSAQLSVSTNPDTVIAGTPSSVSFTVTDKMGAVVIGATVTLTGVATGSGTTDASGSIAINVNASNTGTITATARKTGLQDGSTTITVTDAAEQVSTVQNTIPAPVTASPTIITLQGKLTNNAGDYVQEGSMKVTIYDLSGARLWQETFDDVIDNGVFNIPLGAIQELKLIPGSVYQMEVAIDAESATYATPDVTFGDKEPVSDVIKFKA